MVMNRKQTSGIFLPNLLCWVGQIYPSPYIRIILSIICCNTKVIALVLNRQKIIGVAMIHKGMYTSISVIDTGTCTHTNTYTQLDPESCIQIFQQNFYHQQPSKTFKWQTNNMIKIGIKEFLAWVISHVSNIFGINKLELHS